MKIDRETADAVVELMHNPKFQVFCNWLDALNTGFTENAIAGISHDDSVTPDVLRGRAQAMQIIKQQMTKAPEVAQRIQRVS
jgi:hypothetical protein